MDLEVGGERRSSRTPGDLAERRSPSCEAAVAYRRGWSAWSNVVTRKRVTSWATLRSSLVDEAGRDPRRRLDELLRGVDVFDHGGHVTLGQFELVLHHALGR